MKIKTLGILGGGQLALMLGEAAKKLGTHVVVLCESLSMPACNVADEVILGDLRTPESLMQFLGKIEVLTFENEFVDVAALATSLEQSANKPNIYPSLTSIGVSQNKLRQKELFHRLHVETSKHVLVEEEGDLVEAADRLGLPFVLKWAMYGYDGNGNKVVRTEADFPEALKFIEVSKTKNTKCFAEAFVTFDAEVAMVYTRTRAGNFENFPLVKTEQINGTCKTVEGPATRLGLIAGLESQAVATGRHIGDALQLVGTFAVEYFVVGKKLVINEMAPRVHNSGHFSLNSLEVSQFENHVRAVCGMNLISPGTAGYFGMVNILGVADFDGRLTLTTEDLGEWMKGESIRLDKSLFPYWYGKDELRPGRKLGHINVKADSLTQLMSSMMLAKEAEIRFWDKVRQKGTS